MYLVRMISIFCLFSFSITLFGNGSNETTNVRKLGDLAEEAFYYENYREAIELYYRLDSLDPGGHSYYMYQIGLSYLYSNLDNEQAIPNIEESVSELSQGELADALYYHLGRAYHLNYEFDKAIENYNKVLELIEHYDEKGLQKEVTRQIEICENAKTIVNDALDVKITEVGSGVNTTWPDYKPIITTDEAFLYFTSRRPNSTGEKTDKTGRYYEDIYVTERDVFGYWGYPNHISKMINTEFDEATIGLSADGHKLYMYKGDVHGGDVYISELKGNEWTEPVVTSSINSKSWETSATITGDGKTMFFVSNRKGGNGDRDIYKATLQDDGTWGEIVNLGSTINTAYDEDTPFIHPNGKTLYFSSTGHNTMGGFDIFKSELVNGEWTQPINLGYPINTTCDDFHFVTNARGNRGYYSSAQTGGLGEQDIYSVDFPDAEIPILLVRGNVVIQDGDLASSNPKIKIIDKSNNNEEIHTIYQPNTSTGKYLITLPPAHEYEMIVEADGYEPHSTTVKMPDVTEFHEVYQVITLSNEGVEVASYLDDARNPSDGDTSLVSTANLNNRDYLKTVAENLDQKVKDQGLNSMNELEPEEQVTINQAMNMTDHVADKLVQDQQEALATAAEENNSNETAETSESNNSGDNNNSEGDSHTAAFTFEVKFGFDKFTLDENYLNDVEVIYSTYKRHQEAYIEITGHTDSKGSEAYNIALSQRRADAVAKYLKDKGVPKDHIITKAAGESQPLAPNTNPDGTDNPEGRAKNRRTEVKIVNH